MKFVRTKLVRKFVFNIRGKDHVELSSSVAEVSLRAAWRGALLERNMVQNIEKHFAKIGAKIKVAVRPIVRNRDSSPRGSAVALDVIERPGNEFFEIRVREDVKDRLELSALDIRPKDRHLVLVMRLHDEEGNLIQKNHFLCGHDERHFFIATVAPVSTVDQAKASLKPELIRDREIGLNSRKKNRRKTKNFIRQGEWFFVPVEGLNPPEHLVHKYEPIIRTFIRLPGARNKAHVAQYAYRRGGDQVWVCGKFPTGLLDHEYKELIKEQPVAAHYNWRRMLRNPTLYAKGTIRHPDHATIVLHDWHRVFLNTERAINANGTAVVRVDFLD